MLITSFDVGMKNLAYCIISYDFDGLPPKINTWGVVDITPSCEIKKCCKDGCKHAAKKYVGEECFCGIHSKNKDGLPVIQQSPSEALFTTITTKMNDISFIYDSDICLIEQQPKCNPTMRMIASGLITCMIVNGIQNETRNMKNATFFSPKRKLSEGILPEGHTMQNYKGRKKASIAICRNLLPNQSQEVQDIFKSTKKKDDLADAFLQGLSYLDSFN
jgi:hypothetical protein